MGRSAKQRRELAAQGNPLKPLLSIGDAEPSESLLNHLREALQRHSLVKVRIQSDDRARCDEIARAVAAGVPCEFISRTGFTALLAPLVPTEAPDSNAK